jgi:hypothetical protein
MDNSVIASLPAESENLAIHVQLCEQRYLQLLNKFDQVDTKFEKIETMLVDIKTVIKQDEKENTSLYLKWAGALIGVLSTTLIGLVVHLLIK